MGIKGRFIPELGDDSKPKAAQTPAPKPASTADNALWRVPTWFKELPPPVLERLKAYHSDLLKFNLKVNLISRNTERESDEIHFADGILATQLISAQHECHEVYDVGSGNGFPGIIMSVLDPDRSFKLVESDSRKCEFLKHVIQHLGLKNVEVLNARFDSLMNIGVEVAVSRGVASISKTLLAFNKVFGPGGRFFHLKGRDWSSEVVQLPSQLISVWRPTLVGEYFLPHSQVRRAVVMTTKSEKQSISD